MRSRRPAAPHAPATSSRGRLAVSEAHRQLGVRAQGEHATVDYEQVSQREQARAAAGTLGILEALGQHREALAGEPGHGVHAANAPERRRATSHAKLVERLLGQRAAGDASAPRGSSRTSVRALPLSRHAARASATRLVRSSCLARPVSGS